MCVNVGQLSNKNLFSFNDFVNDDSVFLVPMAQPTQAIFNNFVSREQKKRRILKQMDALTLLLHLI